MPSASIPKTLKVTIAATDVAQQVFSSSFPKIQDIRFHALSTNAGVAYLGDSTVKQSTQVGEPLAANALSVWSAHNLIPAEKLYVAGTANDVIAITYFEVI